jgi:hypothetical protein
LYSAENLRRLLLLPLSMIHSFRTFVLLGVSTQPGESTNHDVEIGMADNPLPQLMCEMF